MRLWVVIEAEGFTHQSHEEVYTPTATTDAEGKVEGEVEGKVEGSAHNYRRTNRQRRTTCAITDNHRRHATRRTNRQETSTLA